MDHDDTVDDETLDWDAAFEAIVAPLRPSRKRIIARAVGEALVAGLVMMTAAWMLVRLVADPLAELGHPWH